MYFRGVQVRAKAIATTYTIRIKAEGLTMGTFLTRVSPETTATGNSQPFTLEITTIGEIPEGTNLSLKYPKIN